MNPLDTKKPSSLAPPSADVLRLSDFDYVVPEALVAQTPAIRREEARLLVRSANGSVRHCHVRDLPDEIPEDSLVIVNNSRVIASRIHGHLATGGRVEVFLLEPAGTDGTWIAMGKPLRKLALGTQLRFAQGVTGRVTVAPQTESVAPTFAIQFAIDANRVMEWIDQVGVMPLPPYIRREVGSGASESVDRERYQTIFSETLGSVAAPTAGLHYSPEVLAGLRQKNIVTESVTLHVGAGTFLPVKTETIADHQMHQERYFVPRRTLEALLAAKAARRTVIGVGTTTLRCLESLHREAKDKHVDLMTLADSWRRTDLFLRPQRPGDRYRPWSIDGLQTNFHQPQSTLLMLVSALIGFQETKDLYQEAVRQRYRLFSYGDSSLLWL